MSRDINDQMSNTSQGGITQKDKTYTLQNGQNKLNRTEPVTYGNYFVSFDEMFKEGEDYTDYMKKRVSLFNNDGADKKEFKINIGSFLKPSYFQKFGDETGFYIFYYMTKDTGQLFAAEQLYKNDWKYNTQNQIWFKSGNTENSYLFFNPLEWITSPYVYGEVDEKLFGGVDEVKKYVKQLQIENNN